MKILNPKQTLKTCIASSLLLFTLASCNSSSSGSGSGNIKLYNLSPDSPTIYLSVDEDITDTDDDHYEDTFTGLTYGNAHSNISLTEDTYYYSLAWQDGDSTDVDDLAVIFEDYITIKEDTINLIVLDSSVLTPQVNVYTMDVIDDDDDDDDELFNIRVLNMHSNQEGVDVYISDEDETFNEAVLLDQSVAYQQLTDNQKLDQDDYIFYITLAGSEDVLFESDSIEFSYSSQNIMIVRDNEGSGSSEYVMDKMSNSSVVEYVDAESEAEFRIYNSVAEHVELPNYQEEVILYLNGTANDPIIDSLVYGSVSEAVNLESGDYSLDVTAVDGTLLLANHLLSVTANTNKTVFVYAEEEYVDDDGDGDIDENNDGVIDDIDVNLFTLVVENSTSVSIYQHEVEIVNLIQDDDFSSVDVYFVKDNETKDTASYSRSISYKANKSVTLPNNTYYVYVIATENGSEVVLNQFELILDEDSDEQYLVLEPSDSSATGYKTTMFSQIETDDAE